MREGNRILGMCALRMLVSHALYESSIYFQNRWYSYVAIFLNYESFASKHRPVPIDCYTGKSIKSNKVYIFAIWQVVW